jgi:hypothetical protein
VFAVFFGSRSSGLAIAILAISTIHKNTRYIYKHIPVNKTAFCVGRAVWWRTRPDVGAGATPPLVINSRNKNKKVLKSPCVLLPGIQENPEGGRKDRGYKLPKSKREIVDCRLDVDEETFGNGSGPVRKPGSGQKHGWCD